MKLESKNIKNPMERELFEAAVLRGKFTRAELAEDTGYGSNKIQYVIRHWLKAEIITVVQRIKNREFYMFVAQNDLQIERRSSVEAGLWTAMRLSKTFTPTDLVAALAAAHPEIDLKQAKSFCSKLTTAGYLKVLDKAVHGRNEARYRLLINSGPMAPKFRRVSVLWDPNIPGVVWVPEGTA